MAVPTTDAAQGFAPFEVSGQLGKGGSGAVYRARLRGEPVALKVLRPDVDITDKEARRFFEEANRLAALDHPSIVKVRECGRLADGRPYLAMELIEGTDLGRLMHERPLAREEILDYFAQLCDAVECLHQSGLVHRDLKLANAMIRDDGRSLVLLDLGIAKEADSSPSTTTQAGFQRGTPAYMAPERFFGARASVASDIYELAVVFYMMLCGRLPWSQALDPNERMNPRRPSERGIQLGAALEEALMQGLSTSPESRPPSALAFRQLVEIAVEKDAAGAPTGASDSLAFGHTQVDPQQLAIAETIASDALPDAGRLAQGTGRQQSSDDLSGSTSTEKVSRSSPWMWIALLLAGALIAVVAFVMGASNKGEGPRNSQAAVPLTDASVLTAAALRPDASAPDAATPDAASGADEASSAMADAAAPARPTRPRQRREDIAGNKTKDAPPPSPPSTTARRSAPSIPPALRPQAENAAPSPDLPHCKKYPQLYCNDAFMATEGEHRGAQCRAMRNLVKQYSATPEKARLAMDESCKKTLPGLREGARKRILFHAEMKNSPVPPPTP